MEQIENTVGQHHTLARSAEPLARSHRGFE
jgi:hypothetical protein